MAKKIRLPDLACAMPHTFYLFDDMYAATGLFTELEADAASTLTFPDKVGGNCQILTGTTDNDEAGIETANVLLFAADKPWQADCRLQYAEANTDDANVCFGVTTDSGANTLGDDGAGPPGDYEGALIYKVDGGTRWQVESSIGTSQTTTDTDVTAGGSSFHTLRIRWDGEGNVTFWIDTAGGQNFTQMRENGSNPRTPLIKHTVATSANLMSVVAYAKSGDTNAETILVDYISVCGDR